MRSNDIMQDAAFSQRLAQAIESGDANAYASVVNERIEQIAESIRAEYEELRGETDAQVLAARGVRQLTGEERSYYQSLAECMRAADPRQALTNANLVMPQTVVDAVFEELQSEHPLLSRVDFIPTGGAVRMLMNMNDYQKAAWGDLCAAVVAEIVAGFKVVNTTLDKLSAVMPVCKAELELGPEWLDNYVRQCMFEILANGLEDGIVNGTGASMPIGMTRYVGDDASVVGGVYPAKNPIVVTDFGAETLGKLISMLAIDGNGKSRRVREVMMLVNPVDYYAKIRPATSVMAPDGTYRSSLLYPVDILECQAVPQGKAVIGLPYRYAAFAGMPKEGRIEYSDDEKFSEDKRVYLIKLYANGLPKDNNAFLVLDVSGVVPAAYKVQQVSAPAPGAIGTLSSLSLGTVSLSPAFAPATTAYTAATTNATNVIRAIPTDLDAAVEIKLGSGSSAVVIENGAPITWASGSNTVTVKVTPADGTTAATTYTITVTKS